MAYSNHPLMGVESLLQFRLGENSGRVNRHSALNKPVLLVEQARYIGKL